MTRRAGNPVHAQNDDWEDDLKKNFDEEIPKFMKKVDSFIAALVNDNDLSILIQHLKQAVEDFIGKFQFIQEEGGKGTDGTEEQTMLDDILKQVTDFRTKMGTEVGREEIDQRKFREMRELGVELYWHDDNPKFHTLQLRIEYESIQMDMGRLMNKSDKKRLAVAALFKSLRMNVGHLIDAAEQFVRGRAKGKDRDLDKKKRKKGGDDAAEQFVRAPEGKGKGKGKGKDGDPDKKKRKKDDA